MVVHACRPRQPNPDRPSSGTLSISRVRPARAAITSVGRRRSRRPRRSRRRGRQAAARAAATASPPLRRPPGRLRSRAGWRRARARSAGESRTFRDESARPSASRTVGTTRISRSRFRSRTICLTTATCCASFCPKNATRRADDREELDADGGDAAEMAGPMVAFETARRRRRSSIHVA